MPPWCSTVLKSIFFSSTLSSFKHLQHVSLIITATCSKCPSRLHTCYYLCHLMCPSSLLTPTVASFMASSNLKLASSLSLSCIVIHMPCKRNLLSPSQVTNWAKPTLHLLISNFLWRSVEKFCCLCAETFRCTTMLQEAHFTEKKKWICPSITCLIRLLILCTSVLTTTLCYLWIFLSPGVQISGAGNTVPRKLSLIREQYVREDM